MVYCVVSCCTVLCCPIPGQHVPISAEKGFWTQGQSGQSPAEAIPEAVSVRRYLFHKTYGMHISIASTMLACAWGKAVSRSRRTGVSRQRRNCSVLNFVTRNPDVLFAIPCIYIRWLKQRKVIMEKSRGNAQFSFLFDASSPGGRFYRQVRQAMFPKGFIYGLSRLTAQWPGAERTRVGVCGGGEVLQYYGRLLRQRCGRLAAHTFFQPLASSP